MNDELAIAIGSGLVGVARLDAALRVVSREGQLSDWLPPIGALATDCALLFGLEDELHALQPAGSASSKPLSLPDVHLPEMGDGVRANIVVVRDGGSGYAVFTMADQSASEIAALLTAERRSKQMADERAEAAQRLARAQEARYRDIVESGDDLVIRIDESETVVFANRAARASLDLADGEDARRRLATAVPLPHGDAEWRDLLARARSGESVSFERRDDAAQRWHLWSVKWLGANGGPQEFQAVARDITALHRLQEQTLRANEQTRVSAVAQERLRIARDMHDTLIQSMVGLLTRIRLVLKMLGSSPERVLAELSDTERTAREGLDSARQAIGGMRAQVHEGVTLGTHVRNALEGLRKRLNIDIYLSMDPAADDLTGKAAQAIARIVSEALRNVERHAMARQVRVDLRVTESASGTLAELAVVDNGIGFELRSQPDGHFGLTGMQEEAALAGGVCSFDTAPDRGTRICAKIPLRSPAAPL